MKITFSSVLSKILFSAFLFYSIYANDGVLLSDSQQAGRISFICAFNGGVGFDEKDVFETTKNEIVTLSAGGGGGFEFLVNYQLKGSFFINAGLGYSESMLSQELKNAAGSFDRLILTTGLGYGFHFSKGNSIRMSAGPGIFLEGVYDIDGAELDNGTHDIYTYDPGYGFISRMAYEMPLKSVTWFNKSWGWGVGINTYFVTYPLKSVSVNGHDINLGELDVPDEWENLNGSGLDISFYLVFQ